LARSGAGHDPFLKLADDSPVPWTRLAAWTAAGTVIALAVIFSVGSVLTILLAAIAFSAIVILVELSIAIRRERSKRLGAG
jgi:hypothetical protein